MNGLKNSELCTLKGWLVWYVTWISVKLSNQMKDMARV